MHYLAWHFKLCTCKWFDCNLMDSSQLYTFKNMRKRGSTTYVLDKHWFLLYQKTGLWDWLKSYLYANFLSVINTLFKLASNFSLRHLFMCFFPPPRNFCGKNLVKKIFYFGRPVNILTMYLHMIKKR